MKMALSAVPVPPAPLSMIQRDYYFYLFASRIKNVLGHLKETDFTRFKYLEPVHLGLLALIAHLEKDGHHCSYFAPFGADSGPDRREELLLEKILNRAHEFELIGFSPITASWPAALRMAETIKQNYPDQLLAVGGPHAWARDKEILATTPFDLVVRKEGEATTAELLSALEEGHSLEKIKGLSYKNGSKIIRNPDRPRLNRATLPMPDYNHLEDNLTADELAPETKIPIPIARVTPATGCANSCVWCADFWKKEVTFLDLQNFQKEVDYLISERDSRYFYLGTHDFFHDIEAALKIAQAMKELRPVMHWEAQTRANPAVTRSILEDLAAADCRCLHVGIESGCQDLLDAMGKNIVLEEAKKMCEMAREVGIDTHTYWLIGVPYETRETAKITIKTMRSWLESGVSSSSEINLLVGYPGTYFYEHPEEYNITWQDSNFSHYDGRSIPTFATRDLTTRDTEYLFQLAMDEYCSVMAGKIGSKETVISELGRRMPNFDPAVMEAAF
jgi:anaerobic magnesium-protoporphyrin IX monomethyl ester cyclase